MRCKLPYMLTALAMALILLGTFDASAQDEEITVPSPAEGPPAIETITFEGNEEPSLFVGYYRLNAGDTIRIELITTETVYRNAMIDDEGYIVFPVLGRVLVADMTLTEARDALQELADLYYRQAWVTCQVVQLGRVKFYVYGDVVRPGFYTASGATTFFDFLQRFGLASATDHRRIVHVQGERATTLPEPRNLIDEEETPASYLISQSLALFATGDIEKIDPRVTIVDPLDFTLEGEIEQRNFYLEYGDVIYVPDPETLVSIEGFRRPGEYEVLPGEGWTDLMRMAGRPSITSDVSNLILERHDEKGKLVQLFYNLDRLDEDKLGQIPVQNRDRLVAAQYEGNVYVLGAVTAAGAFLYNPMLGPIDYLALAGGPTPEAHLRFAVIVRSPRDPNAPLEESMLIPADLVETLTTGAAAASVPMQPGDILFIPDKGEPVTFSNVLSSLSVLINAIRLF
jgi:protein involved in polysaccharide export with SLBB domain